MYTWFLLQQFHHLVFPRLPRKKRESPEAAIEIVTPTISTKEFRGENMIPRRGTSRSRYIPLALRHARRYNMYIYNILTSSFSGLACTRIAHLNAVTKKVALNLFFVF